MRYGLILLLCCVFSAQAEVYRWVDKDGNVIFTDQPHPKAKRVEIPNTPSYKPVPIPLTPPEQKPKQQKQNLIPDYHISIIKPVDNKSFWANSGRVNVALHIVPNLDVKRGDKIKLTLDGQQVGGLQTGASYTLTNVYRGAHDLEAAVVDASGKVLDSTKITFFVHRATVKQFHKNSAPK